MNWEKEGVAGGFKTVIVKERRRRLEIVCERAAQKKIV